MWRHFEDPWENSKWTAFLPISNYRSLEKCQREKKKSLDHMCLCERKIRKCEKNTLIDWNEAIFCSRKKNHTNNRSRKYMEHPWFYYFSGFSFTWSGTNFLTPIDVNEFSTRWWSCINERVWISRWKRTRINVDVNISLTEYFSPVDEFLK